MYVSEEVVLGNESLELNEVQSVCYLLLEHLS
jgi:hypothetical protein